MMRNRNENSSGSERGVVLLLALIALLLISAVGAAILFMTAAESSVVGFQRNTTRAFTAALGAADEARGRLSTGDPSFIGNWQSGRIDFPNKEVVGGVGLGVGANLQVLYILNPAGGEIVAPWVTTDAYYDQWLAIEWGVNIETIPQCAPAPITVPPTVPPPALTIACGWSVMSDLDTTAGPLAGLVLPQLPFKWARITLLTERAANRDIDGDGVLNNTIPVFWNSRVTGCYPSPVLCLYNAVPNTMNIFMNPGLDTDTVPGVQSYERVGDVVYRVTALAALPNGTTRLMQYDVGGVSLLTRFPAAVSIIGANSSCGNTFAPAGNDDNSPTDDNNPGGWGPSNASGGQGQDQAPGGPGGGLPAIGFTHNETRDDCYAELQGAPTPNGHLDNWTGPGGAFTPDPPPFGDPNDVKTLGLIDPNMFSEFDGSSSGPLQQLIDDIKQVADQIRTAADPPPNQDTNPGNDAVDITGLDFGTCSDDFTVSDPKITVLEGDVTVSNLTGCGILLVTGELRTTGSMPKWKGAILVVGEGGIDFQGGGNGQIDGAFLLARIYCDEDDRPGQPNADAANCGGGFPPPMIDPPSRAKFRYTGGGTMEFNFNSFWVNNALNARRYQVLAYREIGQVGQ